MTGLVVICIGGPRDGWAYYERELYTHVAQDAAAGRTFDYVPDPADPARWLHTPAAIPATPLEPADEAPQDDAGPLGGSICGTCTDPVIRARSGPRTINLDPIVTPRGLFRLDQHGTAHRRPLSEVYLAGADDGLGDGHDLHECHVPTAAPRGPDA